jgi:hypothetical protein
MTEVIINIPDSKLSFFMLLIKELDFVVVDKKSTEKKLTAKQKKRVNDLRTALNEVDLHTQGKIQLKTAEQLLDEL